MASSSSCLTFLMVMAHLVASRNDTAPPRHKHQGTVHQCSNHHQSIIKGVNLHKVNVPYENHPFSNERSTNSPPRDTSTRRSMLTTSETAPIRISAYYDPVTITDVLSDAYIAKLKASIGAIVSYYERLIRVVPVSDTFYMRRFCNSWYNSDYGQDCVLYNRGSSIHKCQYATIPEDHFAEQSLFFYPNNRSVTMLPGRGISNTDLVLYVTKYNTHSCGGYTLAHAGPCAYDQYGRPIAGNINVCNYFFDDHEWKTDTDTMLHEMTHITIMLSSLWDEFRDASGAIVPKADVYDDTVVPPVLKSPILLQTVRDYFNCASASGLPVQNVNSSHWHERYTFSEIMNPTTYSQQMYYSKFTLALMEDSGWYLPNYEYAMPYYFGKDAGCAWFTGECIESGASNFPDYFCESSADDGCNADYSAPSNCRYGTTNPPAEYQYFSDNTKGGTKQSNYCPWRSPYFVANPDYEGVCHDIRGNTLETSRHYAETWGATSRCTVSISTTTSSKTGHCYEHACYGWDGTQSQYTGVQITFAVNDVVDCARNDKGTVKAVSSTSSEVILCPNVDVVCGTNSNYGACYWGYYSDVEGTCVCNAGYTGTDCNSKDNATDIEIALVPTTTAPAPDSLLCLKGFDRYPSYNGHWNYVGEHEYNPVYQNTALTRYVWWYYWYHAWYISYAVGDISNYNCKCSVSEYTTDISECNGEWKCSNSLQSQSESLFGWCPYTPTFSPTTRNPTKSPTPAPTSPPTKNPTKRPSNQPTSNPTHNPTPAPTIHPTKSPTPAPTKSPTPSPTDHPTKNPTDHPTHNPTKKPTYDPTTRSPTVDGETRSPTVDPTISPSPAPTPMPSINPSISPTNVPTDATLFPTRSPTDMFVRNIAIGLQYQSTDDPKPCNTTQMESFIRHYADVQMEDLNVILDAINATNDEASGMVVVRFALSSYSINAAALEEAESKITSDEFQQHLIEDLEEVNQYKCFDFVDIIVPTIATTDSKDSSDGRNKQESEWLNTEVHMFEFPYGTTEILVCILSGLILCICLGIIVYFGRKGKEWEKPKDVKRVEFGTLSPLSSDHLFHSHTGMHIVQATPSKVELPDTVTLPISRDNDGRIDL